MSTLRRAHTAGLVRTVSLLAMLGVVSLVSPFMGSTHGGVAPAAALSTASDQDESQFFSNPVLGRGADPSVVHTGQSYYFVQTLPGPAQQIAIRSSRSLRSLGAAPYHVVWQGGQDGSPCCAWWAPELHQLGGKWYIYAAATDGPATNRRMQVLQADDPLGPYTYKGELQLPDDQWAIDGAPLEVPGKGLYFVWSGWPGTTQFTEQDIFLARLSNPWTATGPRVLLSNPTYDWEKHTTGEPQTGINEAPAVLIHGGRIFISYSASGCWTPDYALGLLSADLGSDLTSPSSWTKSAEPVFQSNPDARIYGTGSNQFFTSPDGKETWFVYHAANDAQGNCGLERNVYAQRLTWKPDGTPDFGTPLPLPTNIRLPQGDPGVHP